MGCIQDYIVPESAMFSKTDWTLGNWTGTRAFPFVYVMDAKLASAFECQQYADGLNSDYSFYGVEGGTNCW